ncbi:site-specific integrase [Nocardiopsis dassonvillei]|uniref:tyrosine-type recombinase/integrase n=1 Tax=Nocardiopsis dassonvillei TaxID=2014 RepID=UPI0020A5970E|nr:site-specific integrase [Nocardiopsis dassonvillei]MCP3013005.1 site-specific integrase [Nocardiopsis dassonvillei]
MADSDSRGLSLVRFPATQSTPDNGAGDEDVADVVALQRKRAATASAEEEQQFFLDTMAEYQWARDVAGLTAKSLTELTRPVFQLCEHYGVAPWKLKPKHVDQFYAGPGKRALTTLRKDLGAIDSFFAFLEQRYAGEIFRRFGDSVESPVDVFNRPQHRGDFGLRIPPSTRALREFFSVWRADLPNARKELVAARDYVMAKTVYISGVRAAELCGVKLRDLHWESGQFGRFLVMGKGARRSGPRPREAFMFREGRELLWWYMEEIRGRFSDDPEHPEAPLWPSERLPSGVVALNLAIAPAVTPSTFRKALRRAWSKYASGPVQNVHPHLLRHACATHNYEAGMSLWEVQRLLGHEWTTTTVRYVRTAQGDPERASLEASDRARQRLTVDKGNLR